MTDGKDKRARRRKNNSNRITEINNFLSFGGTLKVLSESECESIHKTVLQILSEIGLSEISKKTKEVATNAGAFIQDIGNWGVGNPCDGACIAEVYVATNGSFQRPLILVSYLL